MNTYVEQQSQAEEKKIRRKARRWATLLLLLLLLLLIFPFVSGQLQTQQKYDKVVTVLFEEDFSQSSAATKKSSSSAAKSETEAEEVETPEEEEIIEEVEPQPEPPEPKPKTKVKPVEVPPTQRKPVLTSPEPNLRLDAMLKDMKVAENAQVEAITNEIVEVVEEVSNDDIAGITDYFKKVKKKTSGGKYSLPKASGDSGTGKDDGEGDQGSSTEGDSKTDGQGETGDSGNDGMDFEGDGLLTRKVIYRANLDGIIKKTGKIVINLCVNRDGRVIFSEYDRQKSTIKDTAILKKAERTASQYRYEKDYTVAERQCGRLSFVVKIQD